MYNYNTNHHEEYAYDSLNRLVRADLEDEELTWVYEYDASGNIKSKKHYNCVIAGTPLTDDMLLETVTYTYGDANWKDKLTAYNGKAITYDSIGNPLTYDGQSFSWVGRRMSNYSNGSISAAYKYNWDGVRTEKKIGDTVTSFFLDGSTILAQKTGNTVIPFYYDANGKRVGFKYNGEMYWYLYNLQGDVMKILKSDRTVVGTYKYDAWGKLINTESLTEIAQINPFRYRGYYYDNESGLYYLNSRYYNPEWGRFINADAVLDQRYIMGSNLFTYSLNNPIMFFDLLGLCAIAWAAGYQGPCPGIGKPGCMDNLPQFRNTSNIIASINKKTPIDPTVPPPPSSGYVPPKKNPTPGKVPNPNGSGKGWPSEGGGVWVPDNKQHGGPGWTEQFPGGKHKHHYPDGHVRELSPESINLNPLIGTGLVVAGVAVSVYIIFNDVTGVGIADDWLLGSTGGLIANGGALIFS